MGYAWDSHFRTVAHIWTTGLRLAAIASSTGIGIRPSLK